MESWELSEYQADSGRDPIAFSRLHEPVKRTDE